MTNSVTKFLIVVALLSTLAYAIGVTTHEAWLTAWYIIFIFLGLPLLVVTWFDLGRMLRSIPNPSPFVFSLGVFFGVPQAMFGLCALLVGMGIIAWVLYNSFIERLPQYSGGFLTLGIGPILIFFGVACLRQAFTRGTAKDEPPAGERSN
jgi:hypothetical protein